MNVREFLDSDALVEVKNPNYNPRAKKNKQPKTIMVEDLGYRPNPALNLGIADARDRRKYDAELVEKYAKYGINYNTWEDLDTLIADRQSKWEKAKNAVYQTVVNEIGLGTLRGISDLCDMVYNFALDVFKGGNDNDYTNPVSEQLKEWQDQYEKEHPIYVKPGLDISNGGLTDFGWWMSNIPSVASSLTLLIPSTGAAKLLSLGGKAFRVGKGTSAARKFLTNINKVDKAVEEGQTIGKLGKISQFINNENTIATANRLFENTVNGFTMRLMENYQEANQVYNDLLPEMLDGDKENGIQGINQMNDVEYQALINRNKDVLDGVDTSNRVEVAKRLAKAGADRTFQADLINGLFDVYEVYALRNFKPLKNAPMRAKIRREHLNSIKYAGKSKEEVAKILAGRSKAAKVKEWVGDRLIGSGRALTAQISEGVEEAINYIAQEEGMHYGHILLHEEDKASTLDTRLIDYLKSPQLYEAAFWGVAGGVMFQAGGSKLNQTRNAISNRKNKKKYEAKDKSGEAVQRTPWSEAFETPEVKARIGNIQARYRYEQDLKTELEQIKNKIDPWNKNPDGTNRTLSGPEEQAVARDRAYRKRTINLLMDSMFNGNWSITRAYLESDEVRDALVQAGIVSSEEASRRQQEARELANKLEDSYSRNLRIIGNAMRTVKGEDDKEKIPIEYMQIIAAENMYHEIDAEQYQRNIDAYSPTISAEEERLAKELADRGIDYKNTIKAYILAQQLGEIEAELESARKTVAEGRTKNDLDARLISGQIAVKELELRKKVLTDMINNLNIGAVQSDGSSESIELANRINKSATALVSLRAVTSMETDGNGKYRINRTKKRYRDLDAAIVKAFNAKDDAEWEQASEELYQLAPNLRERKHTRESFQEAARTADVFNEHIEAALGPNGTIENLDNLSHNLLKAYASVSYNEIYKNYELAQIVKDRKSVRQRAFDKHTDITTMRYVAVESAVNSLKGIFAKYYDEHGDISNLLATGTINKASREQLKSILSEDDMTTYDDIMDILRLNSKKVKGGKYNTSVINDPLVEMVQDALYRSSLDKFEDYREPVKETEDTKSDEEVKSEPKEETPKESNKETKKKSTTSQERDTAKKTPKTTNKSKKVSESDTSDESSENIDFTRNAKGKKLTSPYADVWVEDDADAEDNNRHPKIVKLSQYDRANNEDSYGSVTLIPTGNENEYELDYKGDFDNREEGEGSIPKALTNSSIFVWNNGQAITNGGTILRNPKVTVDSKGNVIEFIPGKIGIEGTVDEDGEVQQDETQSASILSTGGQESKVDVDADVDIETFDDYPEQEEKEEKYSREEVQQLIHEEMIAYAVEQQEAGKEYDEAELLQQLLDAYKDDIDEEDIRAEFERLKGDGLAMAKELKLGIKAIDNIAKFVQNSAIADSAIDPNKRSDAYRKLESLFEEILNDYLSRTVRVVRKRNGKEIKVISLENLLRYANEVAGSKKLGRILYERFLDMIEDRKDVQLIEGYKLKELPKEKIISRSEMTTKQRDAGSELVNGRTIDFDYITEDLSEEQKQQVYDIRDELFPGNDIDFEVNGNTVLFKKNNVTIAAIKIPDVEGNKFIYNNNGWVIDLPRTDDGTQSNTEQFFVEIMTNPENKPELQPVIDALEDAMYTKRYDKDEDRKKRKFSKEFNKKCERIITALQEAGIDLSPYLQLPDNKDESDAGRQLVEIYGGMKRATEQWIAKAGLTNEEYRKAVAERRAESIHRFFQNRYDSASSAYLLSSNPELKIKIDDIREGGLHITSQKDALPLNDKNAIGSDHKDSIEIVAASITDVGKLHSTDGRVIPFAGVGAANTFVSIKRANGSIELVHAFPQGINSSHFGRAVKAIHNEVLDEFERLLTDWSNNPNKSSLEIAKFINTLCSSKDGNNALFKGFKVSNLTGGYKGIQIEYVENGTRKYIHLFDENTYGDRDSVIRFPGEKAKRFKESNVRKEVIAKFKDIVSNSLKYNLEFDYIKGTRDLRGFARRNAKGEFIIQIPGGKQHKFKSFKDFVINNGIVKVTTRTLDGKTNFYKKRYQGNDSMDNPRYTYKIVSQSTTPVEESTSSSTEVDNTQDNKLEEVPIFTGDDAKKAIEKDGDNPNLAQEIINNVLNDSQLKILKDSKILKDLTFGSIIFVERLNPNKDEPDAIAAHVPSTRTIQGRKVAKGTIIVTQEWVNMLNSDFQDDREEAIRHLIHESVHRKLATLSKVQKEELYEEVRNIFDAFVAANEADGLRDAYAELEYNTTEEKVKKYYTDGKLNYKGLEEFLIESLTRPKLMKRLNEISADGGTIKEKQKVGNVRSKSLLQRILAAIAKAFNSFINKGSLLEKEYQLFAKLSVFNDNVQKAPRRTTRKQNVKQTKNTAQLEINFNVDKNTQKEDSDKPVDVPNVKTTQSENPTAITQETQNITMTDARNSILLDESLIDESSISDKEINSTYTDEMNVIKEAAIANGTFMKAPNGQPTKLNERQWLQVRTKNFINWFGDWINDPENASKVIDNKGEDATFEPLVVYHGTNNKFTKFDRNKLGSNTPSDASNLGFFAASNEEAATYYASEALADFGSMEMLKSSILSEPILEKYAKYLGVTKEQALDRISEDNDFTNDYNNFGELESISIALSSIQEPNINWEDYVKPVFLNIKNPRITDENGSERFPISDTLAEDIKTAIADGKDGNIIKNIKDPLLTDNYVFFNPNQIKSAKTNNGDFSTENDDINYSSISDKEISSTAQVRDKIIPENQETFESLIQKGGIEINC